MGRPSRAGELKFRDPATRPSERGFTLAAVLVLLTIMMVVVAYTVPRMWSTVLKRDRERQTIYAMQQYARACREWAKKHGNTYPVNPTLLKDARSPRLIRGTKSELIDPLTGEVDWLVIPQAAALTVPPTTIPPTGTTGTQPKPPLAGIPIKDYAGGPFVGVRPPVSGKALISLNGNDTYETWSFTAIDLEREINVRMAGLAMVWK
jgi:type II secretory pathway pseudopilin PulG